MTSLWNGFGGGHEVKIPVGDDGEVITMTVDPSEYNALTEARIREMSDDQQGAALIVDIFVRFVKSWDATYPDGTPIPLTVESLSAVPTVLLVGLWSRMSEEGVLGTVGEASGGTSAAG